jgi:hydroxyacylglutathione hydrolase
MLFERIESEGLAHYSYLIGQGGEALVMDPRRDCEVYVDMAVKKGYRIKFILETHRNEDYVVGSVRLASLTGAEIWHADGHLNYGYGKAVEDGQNWHIGALSMRAMHSPGHTEGSMSYLLHDAEGNPWILFTGDALFAGDVGRVDLMGMDRAEEMAGRLFDTLFNKFLPLGDGIIVCPAHGAGSVCAGSIADRKWTSIGLERKYNPRLQSTDREDFIADTAEELERPPYFLKMEEMNLKGSGSCDAMPIPNPLSPEEIKEITGESMVLDTRSELAFGSGHIPHSLFIWLKGLPNFAGWFLPYDRNIILVNESGDPANAARLLRRMGHDNITGFLSGGMHSWHTSGLDSFRIRTVTVQKLCKILDGNESPWILDVRSPGELRSVGMIPGAHKIHITRLPEHLDDIPRNRDIYIFCGSGLRSMTAASIMMRNGFESPVVVLGGFAGWNSVRCKIQKKKRD